jgi:hypothetical protein
MFPYKIFIFKILPIAGIRPVLANRNVNTDSNQKSIVTVVKNVFPSISLNFYRSFSTISINFFLFTAILSTTF